MRWLCTLSFLVSFSHSFSTISPVENFLTWLSVIHCSDSALMSLPDFTRVLPYKAHDHRWLLFFPLPFSQKFIMPCQCCCCLHDELKLCWSLLSVSRRLWWPFLWGAQSSALLCLLHELPFVLWRWVVARQNSWTPSSWRENDLTFLYYFHPESVLLLTSYFLPLILFIFAFIFSPTGRLEEYLNCMDKIQKAVEYFQDNNPDSPELNRVVGHGSGSLHGWDRDSHSPATCPLAVRGWWALLPGKEVVWAQLKKWLLWFLFESEPSSISACDILLFSCFMPLGFLKVYPAREIEMLEPSLWVALVSPSITWTVWEIFFNPTCKLSDFQAFPYVLSLKVS